MALPAVSYLDQNTRTEGEMKVAFEDQLKGIKQVPGAGVAEQALTLATDTITPALGASGVIAVDTEAAAAADNLATIAQTNCPDGTILLIGLANAAHVVTVKHLAGGTGQISLRSTADLVMSLTTQWLMVKRTGTLWEEIWRSGGEAFLNMTGGINDAKTTIASATTPDIFAITVGNTINYTGSVLCTGFVASPQAGPSRTLVCAGGAPFTAGANMIIAGVLSGQTVTCAVNDEVTVLAFTTTEFHLSIKKADAIAVQSGNNPILNAMFEHWPAGTAFSAIATGTYHADAWEWFHVGAGVVTVRQSTDVPTVAQAGLLIPYSLEVDVTTADAAIAAGDLYLVETFIEGYTWRDYAQRTFVIGFWVRDTITGEHAVMVGNNVDRSFVGTYTINVADTWEYKTVVVTPSPSAGTWNYTNGLGLVVLFPLAVGSTFHTTAGAWQTGGPFYGTATMVNSMSSASNFFRVTVPQIQLGSTASQIRPRSLREELVLLEPYYQTTYPLNVAPGTVDSTGTIGVTASSASSASASIQWDFSVRMRTTPTIVTYSPVTGTSGKLYRSSALADVASGTTFTGQHGVLIYNNAGVTANEWVYCHATAKARF